MKELIVITAVLVLYVGNSFGQVSMYDRASMNLYCQIRWEKHPDNPVVDLGPTGSWDDENPWKKPPIVMTA